MLGAGFSAPLGLPVMANFLEKAKDQYYAERERFADFTSILDTINRMHVANSYYRTDLLNIEEILSILEMQDQLSPVFSPTTFDRFRRFITQVIQYYTPPLTRSDPNSNDWVAVLFGDRPWADYGPFVAALLGCEFTAVRSDPSTGRTAYEMRVRETPSVRYSVVTLNYDLLLETTALSLREVFGQVPSFAREEVQTGVPLAKLHGSIDTGDVIPPTWSKGLSSSSIVAAWQCAYRALRDANEIRFIGYSLPESDNYVRYLLRAAAIDAPNLKRIHALGLDPDGSLKQRYEQFITHRSFQFMPVPTESYMSRVAQHLGQWPRSFSADTLEQVHYSLFKR
jgi:hypothetical protein